MNLLGEEVGVRAHIHTINGFSAHADQQELVARHRRIAGSKATFLVHDDDAVMRQIAGRLGTERIEMPVRDQAFDL